MLNTIDKVLFLMRAGITADATTDALSRLAQAAREIELARGERLFSPGDDAEALYIVLDGAVRVDAEEAPPRVAEAGDWVGALPLLSGGPHRGTATTLVSTRLLKLERADVHELLDEDGELARALFAGLVRSLSTLIPGVAEAA
jgi:CRP-like cAMP-binding protein